MKKIKLFLCCHNKFEIVPPLFEPMQCGAALNPAVEGTVSDFNGDNISNKNREYCELTAHYFAWKNIEADYYGFCHYRRFFSINKKIKKPYISKKTISAKEYKEYFGNEQMWYDLITSNDIIVPRRELMEKNVRDYYCDYKYHYKEDLSLFMDILSRKAGFLDKTAEKYLSQNKEYFCNMFIMKKEYFNEYCDILFSVLEEFDEKKTLHGDFQSDRTDGFLAELFTGIYIFYCYNNNLKIKELPRLDVGVSAKKRILNVLLPPESKRRFLLKKALNTGGKQNV